MAQEFTINSTAIEDKINQLLPSQGGFGAGVDFSASTMVIPTINLTETAEGSSTRQDLQSSFSFTTTNYFLVAGATNTTIISTTGYYKVQCGIVNSTSGAVNFNLFDGTTQKIIFGLAPSQTQGIFVEFMVFIGAGESLRGTATIPNVSLQGSFRQIADISGNLVNP